nr:STAS domain-containing protein [Vibrio amylolyticus]
MPQELTIYEVGDVHRELNELVESDPEIQLDASQIEEIDTSGLQLILWFSKLSKQYHEHPPLCSLSDVVSDYVRLLNLETHLLAGSDGRSLSENYEY